jgi:hypothetical protein
MRSMYDCCHLRPEVLNGDLDDAIFAADFGHVVEGVNAPAVYLKPEEFFKNTHPAMRLKKVVTTIFDRLADPKEAGALIRLSTGFGGGKTHTLIALWHLAHNINKATLGTELLPAAGRVKKIAVAGIDGDKTGSTVCLQHGDFMTHSLWGEIAYQLGGEKGYAKVQSVDNPETVPHSALIREMMPADEPVLILLDELVLYMTKLSEQGRKGLLSFINSLISEVRAKKQAVLVITDPANQASYQQEAAQLAQLAELETAHGLDDVLGRKMTDFDPIGDETAQVIVRRLFTHVDKSGADEVSSEYYNAYTRIIAEHAELLPAGVDTAAYAARIVECYPFHPRLLETTKERLGALQVFQKSRGTLRLFARILRDTWERRPDIPLITAGDINWANDSIQADLLQRLNKDNFKAAVDADVTRHAGELDGSYSTDIHRRVAAALLLESLPMTSNASMDKRDLALATLHPSEVGNEPGEAIDRLYSICWHTYKNDAGDKFLFRYEANPNKLIEEALESINVEDAKSQVRALVLGYFKGGTFDLKAYPQHPSEVQDSAKLKLVLCDAETQAQAVCNYEDDTDPAAKRPRRFRNAILAIAPSPSALQDAVQAIRWKMAAEAVRKEYKDNKEVVKQIDALMPTLVKRGQISSWRAFHRVVFQGRPSVTLDEQYLVSEDSVLQSPNGQANLKRFLDDAKKIYQLNDALDVDLLLAHIINGSTPALDHPGAYPASAVHERALASDKLRLMLDGSPVRNAVIKAVTAGKLVVRLANGEVYDAHGCVSGPTGERKHIVGKILTTLNLNSDVFIALADAACVADWTAVAAAAEKKTPTTSSNPILIDAVRATTWKDAIEYAAKRPMTSMKLTAAKPDAAKTLAALAQPFGAQALSLTVQAMGQLKEGGEARFMVEGVKHNSNLKPVDFAATLLRAMDDGAEFLTEMALDFGDGMKSAGVKLEKAQQSASDDVGIEAAFGKEGE